MTAVMTMKLIPRIALDMSILLLCAYSFQIIGDVAYIYGEGFMNNDSGGGGIVDLQ